MVSVGGFNGTVSENLGPETDDLSETHEAMQRKYSPMSWAIKSGTVVSVAAVALILVLLAVRARSKPDNLELSVDSVAVRGGLADESSCVECHAEAEEFFQTGHANTLRRANDPKSLVLLRQLLNYHDAASEGTSIKEKSGSVIAVNRTLDVERRLHLDWCFGSGTHACTWVATMPDSFGNTDALEFRWSWFEEKHGFDLTPGQPKEPGKSAASAQGLFFDGPKARRCFSCHATHVPVFEGCIEDEGILPGVTCQRCHGPRQQHVLSGGDVHPKNWRIQDRMEAVSRCAVCHRLPEEREPEAIVADNPDIVRFQPMGLMQSKCFVNSDMRCTTCHDPHRTMKSQDAGGIWQCIQCLSLIHI